MKKFLLGVLVGAVLLGWLTYPAIWYLLAGLAGGV